MYSDILCSSEMGSFQWTGIVILLSSLPIHCFRHDHRFRLTFSGCGTGNLVLPLAETSPLDSITSGNSNKYTFVLFYITKWHLQNPWYPGDYYSLKNHDHCCPVIIFLQDVSIQTLSHPILFHCFYYVCICNSPR